MAMSNILVPRSDFCLCRSSHMSNIEHGSRRLSYDNVDSYTVLYSLHRIVFQHCVVFLHCIEVIPVSCCFLCHFVVQR